MTSTIQTVPGDSQNGLSDQHRSNVTQTSDTNRDVRTFRQKFHEYPKSIFFIFSTECCERFSFYGIRAVLVIYFLNVLNYNQNDTTAYLNLWGSLAYFLPLFGAILADGFIGRYQISCCSMTMHVLSVWLICIQDCDASSLSNIPTILWISLIYVAGSIILAVAAALSSATHPWLDWIGLMLICVGTGGIKPCVVAFGGDQFKKGQETWLGQYFSVFYFSINLGALVSTFATPIFRTLDCGDKCSCYPLAFGVPAALMTLATATFAFGTFWYDRKPVKDRVVLEAGKIFYYAIVNKFRYLTKRDHWLEHALDHHKCAADPKCVENEHCHKAGMVKDMRWVARMLIMYAPMILFYAVSEQSGVRWIIQGAQMTGQLGSFNLLPDQMPLLNALVVMVSIPILSFGIYPLVDKCVKVTPLRKMGAGGICYTVGFLVSAIIQLRINDTLPVVPEAGRSRLEVVNYAPCGVTVSLMHNGGPNDPRAGSLELELDSMQSGKLDFLARDLIYSIQPWSNASACSKDLMSTTGNLSADSQTAYYAVIALVYDVDSKQPKLKSIVSAASLEKAVNGEGEFVINFNYLLPDFGQTQFNEYSIFVVSHDAKNNSNSPCDGGQNNALGVDNQTLATPYEILAPGSWDVFLLTNTNATPIFVGNFDVLDQGAIYTLTLYGDNITNVTDLIAHAQVSLHPLASPNSVGILWQVPQYVLVSVGEVLLAVTLYEFSFSQAPESMRSVLQACSLIAVSIGSLLGVPLAEAPISDNAAYLLFALTALVGVVVIIFICLSYFYFEYINVEEKKKLKAAPDDFASASQDNAISVEHY